MAAAAPNDPGYSRQWGMQLIGAAQAWSAGTGKGTTIAVVDTGVDLHHEDLAANIPAPELQSDFRRKALGMLPDVRILSTREAAKQAFGGLTSREHDVALLVTDGKSNRAIAQALVVSERTVETHVARIMSKLGFDSRVQIAAWFAAQPPS